MDDVFVLLDDCQATVHHPSSRLYQGFVREHRCTDARSLNTLWQQVERDQQAGLHAALLIDYEWGSKLQQAGLCALPPNDASALRVLMFARLHHLSSGQVEQWLTDCDAGAVPSPAGVSGLHSDVTQASFSAAIARIHRLIAAGETYQVNYTVRMHGMQYGSPLALYRRLRAMQPVPYGMLARLPATDTPIATATATATTSTASASAALHWVLSRSPELLVQNRSGQLTTRPMKGTALRLADQEADQRQAAWLQNDAKNRAENVMIVDLLRNDLGRIAVTGSVRVPRLFSIESYATVHQMTSTVTAELRADVAFPEVLRALFPCGSITGAPKLHTMDTIAALETSPRGLYCGAIGWLDAPKAGDKTGDFCLSVAIRTLLLGQEQGGHRRLTLGVGSGVVMDSDAATEWAETQSKAHFLTALAFTSNPGFTLFETMRVTSGRIRHLHQHLHRLGQSAAALGFRCDVPLLRLALQAHLHTLENSRVYRLRLDLAWDGSHTLQSAALPPLPNGPALLVLSTKPVPPQQAVLLNHKTSLRSDYDSAIEQATAHGAFDAVFVNAQGQVCEGARSNLLARLGCAWYTPPLSSGVLRGVMRSRVLARFKHIHEKPLLLDEVLSAEQIIVCSALRGLQHAHWLKGADGEVVRV
ncbi:MAG: chorismate-binding protein [Rhodoferax sp.]|nr:chorismate-binding protein [Rhodoferax sp.]